jgi:hypothetical protein
MPQIIGILRPDELYSTAAVLKVAGLGHESLDRARESGIVKPRLIGSYVWYRGEEIIAWMLSVAKPARKQKVREADQEADAEVEREAELMHSDR